MNAYKSIKKHWTQFTHKKILAIVLSIVAAGALLYWLIYPSLTRMIYARFLPDLPDFEGQSEITASYIESMHRAALAVPTSEAVGRLAMAYHANFCYDRAELCYRVATDLDRSEWRWPYYSALIKEELGNSKGTIENLRRVLQINPNVSQAWFRLGNSYLKINSYQDAEGAFKRVQALADFYPEKITRIEFFNSGAFPLKAYASLFLGRCIFQQNKLSEAQQQVERLIEHYPTFGSAYRLLGQIYHELGDEGKSTALTIQGGDFGPYLPPPDPMFDELLLSSRNTDFIMKYIDIAVKYQNIKWAVYLISHILDYNPNDGEALTQLLKLSLDSANFDTMDEEFERYYEIYNSNEDKLTYLANYMIYRGEYSAALKLLRKSISLNPNSMSAHLGFVQILSRSRQYAEAEAYCQRVIAKDGKNAAIRHELAKILIEQGKPAEARVQLRTVQEFDPGNPATWLLLGRIARNEGDVKEGLFCYRRSIAADPLDGAAQLELGNYLLELRRWSEALTHFQSALRASPNDIDLNERCAWILAACPNPRIRDGEIALELALRLSVRKTFTQHQAMRSGIALAVAYAELNQFDRAIQTATRYLERARNTRLDYYVPRLQSLIAQFQAQKPYRL